MRRVAVWALEPGMVVARPLYDARGRLLLGVGMALKNEYINTLKRLGVPAIFVEDGLIPDVDIEDIVLDETRQRAQQAVRGILENMERQPRVQSAHLIFTESKIRDVLQDIIAQLMAQDELVVNLTDIRTTDNYTFAHCVNVAILSLTTAISVGKFSKEDLEMLGIGAIVHDLGKVRIPINILNKDTSMTEEEFAEIKKHPYYGLEIMKAQGLNYKDAIMVVYQHHERTNGSGYPERLRGQEIHNYARICSIVDVYDAMVSDRPYRIAYQPHQAFHYLERSTDEFDPDLMQKFFRHIAAYPIGTIVELSSGEVGVVVKNKMGFPTRPRVRVFSHKDDFAYTHPYEVDLMDRMDVVVKKVFRDSDIPISLVNQANLKI